MSEPSRRPTSGCQTELSYEDQTATVVEVGGALRTYELAGLPLLDGYERHERCSGARGQTMIPWPNRLRDGSYRFGDKEHQLPLSEPAKRNAIHGLVRWANWSVAERSEAHVTMAHTLYPQSGWPFLFELRIDYRLSAEGLSVRTTATNSGAQPAPYGTGAHPYLRLRPCSIDDLVLRAPGTHWTPLDAQGIPLESASLEETEFDFRIGRRIGSTRLDTAYTDLERNESGLAHVELRDPTSDAYVRLWMDAAYRHLMLFTGDSLSVPERRRRGLGVEPMTCAPNALQSGEGLEIIEPGESFTSTWGISPYPPSPQRSREGADA